MQRSSLLDQLLELTKKDYPDDWVRFCHLARVIEEDASLDDNEAARRRLRVHGRYDLAAFSTRLTHELRESSALCWKFVEHLCDVFRNQMVGRIKGEARSLELEPALIRPEALRFDPDELVLDKGKLIIVDVRVEPAPAHEMADRFHSAATPEPEIRPEPELQQSQEPPTPAPLPMGPAATPPAATDRSAAPVGKPVVSRPPGGRPRELDYDAITGVAKDCAKNSVEEFLDRFADRVRDECGERRPVIKTPKSRTQMREFCRPIWEAKRAKNNKK
jgi:hypothetical protein